MNVSIEYHENLSINTEVILADMLEDTFGLSVVGGEGSPHLAEDSYAYTSRIRRSIESTVGRHIAVSVSLLDGDMESVWDGGDKFISANNTGYGVDNVEIYLSAAELKLMGGYYD